MPDVIWNNCKRCCRDTKHTILYRKNIKESQWYNCERIYLVVECNGCEYISFRYEYHDYEDYFQIGEDEYQHSIEVDNYPRRISGHSPIKSLRQIPIIVRSIYEESLQAIQENAFTLAGLGLRASIEAICNDKDIKGKNLQIRINAMQKIGMISKSDADRLHAIRFMGNDAAHEIKKAKKSSVLIALKIVEYILLSVYVFEEEVSKHLEPPFSKLDDAESYLKSALASIEENSIFTFSKWIDGSKRRFEENYQNIENELIAKIECGEFTWVTLSEAPEESFEKDVHWYKRTDVEIKSNNFDDIPF